MVNVELMLVLAAPVLVQAREGGLRGFGQRASSRKSVNMKGTQPDGTPRAESPNGVEYDPYAQQDYGAYDDWERYDKRPNDMFGPGGLNQMFGGFGGDDRFGLGGGDPFGLGGGGFGLRVLRFLFERCNLSQSVLLHGFVPVSAKTWDNE